MTDRDITLKLLQEAPGNMTTSWDWEMDLKFAREIGAEEFAKDIKLLLKSNSPSPLRIIFWDQAIRPTITKRRLRALRKLVEEGLVITSWVGTERGGYTDFGVRRIRGYELVEPTEPANIQAEYEMKK